MRKERFKRKVCYFSSFLVLCLVLYSCLQDEWDIDSHETAGQVVEGKNRELTVGVARSWYETSQAPVVATRSVVTNFELMTKMRWKKAYESRKGKFEVVEIPLLTRGGAVLLDKETKEKYNPATDRKKIRSIARMVIIKNLETGEITNFVMYIIGTYDYLKKAKHFGKNSYLHRDSRFSGSICFYRPEGGLVNGWKYENGKIVGGIKQGTEVGLQMQSATTTRGTIECYFDDVLVEYNECEGFEYYDPEYGPGFGTECHTSERWEVREICKEYEHNDPWYPSGGGGSGSGGGGSTGGNTGGAGGYEPPKKPQACVNVETKLNSPSFNKLIQTLKFCLEEFPNQEIAIFYNHDGTTGEFKTSATGHGQENTPGIIIDASKTSPIDGYIHSHYDIGNSTLPIFSADDLLAIGMLHENSAINDIDNFSTGLYTQEGTFFLEVTDTELYNSFYNKFSTDVTFLSLTLSIYGVVIGKNSSDVIKNFAIMLNSTKSGLTLTYQLNGSSAIYYTENGEIIKYNP